MAVNNLILVCGFTFILLITFDLGLMKKIPDYVPVCKRNNPNFDKCVLESVEVVRPYLAKGIRKMNVPPAEPLIIPYLEINRNTDALQVKAKLKDIQAYGGTKFVINKLKSDLDKLSLELSLTLPKIDVTCDYDIDGRLLVVPLKGKGSFIGNFTDIKADVKGSGSLVTIKGVKYIQIKKIISKIRIGDHNMKLRNVDRNFAAIAETASNFINQNRRQVLDIVTPIAEETADELIVQFGNAIFKTVPFSEILPD